MKRKLLVASLVVLTLGLTGCGAQNSKSSKTTIIDEVTLYETTIRDIKQYAHDKNLTYKYAELFYSPQISTRVADLFLGYDAFYGFYTQEVVSLYDENDSEIGKLSTRDDYLRYEFCRENLKEQYTNCSRTDFESHSTEVEPEDNEPLDDLYISILFKNDEEFKSARSVIEKYLEGKTIHEGEIEGFYSVKSDYTMYPIKVGEIDDINYVECITLESNYYEEGIPEGYCNNGYDLEYRIMSEEDWITCKNRELGEDETEASFMQEDTEASTSDASASESTEETSEVTDNRSAYKEFLRNYTLDTGYPETPRFCLGYVDEDDIPELFVIEGTSHANCVKMYTYINNGVVEIGSFGSYGSMSYAPKCNRFLSSNSGMGLETNYFYYLESGQAWIYCEFEAYTDDNFNTEYTVGGMWSDEVEYTAELEAVKTELGVDFVEVDYDTAYEINEGNIESMQ